MNQMKRWHFNLTGSKIIRAHFKVCKDDNLDLSQLVGWQTSFLVICFRFLFSSFSSSSSSRADTNLLFLGLCAKPREDPCPRPATNWRGSVLRCGRPKRGLSQPSWSPHRQAPAAPATNSIIVEPNSASLSTQIRLRRPEQLIYLPDPACHFVRSDEYHLTSFPPFLSLKVFAKFRCIQKYFILRKSSFLYLMK